MIIKTTNRTYNVLGSIEQIDEFIRQIMRGFMPWDASDNSGAKLELIERADRLDPVIERAI